MSKGIISVAELLTSDSIQEATLTWGLNPGSYVDAERIVVDTAHMRRVARVGGLGRVSVGEYQGYRTQTETAITGIGTFSPDGNATATGVVTRATAERQRVTLVRPEEKLAKEYQQPVARIDINRPEVASRVSDRIAGQATTEKAWSQELDLALRFGLWGASKNNLTNETAMGSAASSIAFCNLPLALQGNTTSLITYGSIYGTFLLFGALQNKEETGSFHLRRLRFSLFPGNFQLDRLAVGGAMLATRRLVGLRS